MTLRSARSPRHRRWSRATAIAAMLGFLSIAAFLALKGFEENVVYFVLPSDVANQTPKPGQQLRLGGLVAEGSVQHTNSALRTYFSVTDGAVKVPVRFDGILPDLFRESQGVIAEGVFDAHGLFVASRVLAKHDEQYMPAEVVASLKKRGLWKEQGRPFP